MLPPLLCVMAACPEFRTPVYQMAEHHVRWLDEAHGVPLAAPRPGSSAAEAGGAEAAVLRATRLHLLRKVAAVVVRSDAGDHISEAEAAGAVTAAMDVATLIASIDGAPTANANGTPDTVISPAAATEQDISSARPDIGSLDGPGVYGRPQRISIGAVPADADLAVMQSVARRINFESGSTGTLGPSAAVGRAAPREPGARAAAAEATPPRSSPFAGQGAVTPPSRHRTPSRDAMLAVEAALTPPRERPAPALWASLLRPPLPSARGGAGSPSPSQNPRVGSAGRLADVSNAEDLGRRPALSAEEAAAPHGASPMPAALPARAVARRGRLRRGTALPAPPAASLAPLAVPAPVSSSSPTLTPTRPLGRDSPTTPPMSAPAGAWSPGSDAGSPPPAAGRSTDASPSPQRGSGELVPPPSPHLTPVAPARARRPAAAPVPSSPSVTRSGPLLPPTDAAAGHVDPALLPGLSRRRVTTPGGNTILWAQQRGPAYRGGAAAAADGASPPRLRLTSALSPAPSRPPLSPAVPVAVARPEVVRRRRGARRRRISTDPTPLAPSGAGQRAPLAPSPDDATPVAPSTPSSRPGAAVAAEAPSPGIAANRPRRAASPLRPGRQSPSLAARLQQEAAAAAEARRSGLPVGLGGMRASLEMARGLGSHRRPGPRV